MFIKETITKGDGTTFVRLLRRRYIRATYPDGNVVETPINGTKRAVQDYYGKEVKIEFLA